MIFPPYGKDDFLTPEEMHHIKAMYAGSVTMADRWFGYFMDAVTALGLLEDTMIVVSQ